MSAIRTEPETLEALLGPAPTPIWIADYEQIVYVNEAAIALLGGSRAEQFLSRSPFDFIPPSFHDLVRRRMHAQDSTGRPPTAVEVVFLTLQGEIVPVLLASIPFPWKGRPAQQIHFTDLRPVNRVQHVAKNASAQIELLTNETPTLLAYFDRDLRHVSANHAYLRWTGVKPDELFGKHVHEIIRRHISATEWDRVDEALQSCLHGKSRALTLHGNHGSPNRILQAYYVPDTRGSGQVMGIAVLVVDVTEQRRYEEELQFRATLIEEALEPIFAWELPGKITYWNRAAEELYGYSPTEALGQCSHELLRTRSQPPMSEIEAILRDESLWQGQLEHQTKSGECLIVEARLRTVQSEGKMYVIECIRDATQRVRAEQDLRRLAATLESRVQERTEALTTANADLEAYAYTISHDLRAPLRTMQGFANALVEDYADALDMLGKRYLQRIGVAAERMDQLISDLLEYSRLGRENIRLDRVELSRVMQDVLFQHQAAIARSKGVVTVAPNLPPVMGHYPMLVQVIGNLLSNALNFRHAGVPPEVRIEAQSSPGRVRVVVSDKGIGIDPEHQSRIFRVFERLHGQESYPGTGIGLAIVKRGIERLGGSVGLTSEPGKGSAFFVELSAATAI